MDAKPSLASAVALDHIAGADWKPAWKTIDRRTHQKNLLRNSRYCRSNGGSARQFRDRQATGRYSCESLWKKGCEGPRGTPTGAGSELEAVVARQVLERRFRPRAEMLDHLGGGERPEPRGGAVVDAARQPDQEAGREQVARPGRVDHAVDAVRRNHVGFLPRHDQTALFAARDHREPRIVAQCVERGVEIRGFVEAVQLALVREHQVDGAAADELEKFRAIAVDAERIR